MSNNWMDLKSIVDLQKKLLVNIRDIPSDGNLGSSGDAIAVANINKSLGTLSNNLDNATSAIGPTLTYQQEVRRILNRENARLVNKKRAVDSAYDGQKRMISLTNSTTAKNKAYNYILFIMVLILFLFVVIKHLYNIEGISHALLDISNVVVISLGLVYCLYLYSDIRRRYNMDFNQITLEEPIRKTPEQIQKDIDDNRKSGNLYALAKGSNSASGCQGSACCPNGSTFNEKYNICVPDMVPADKNGVTSANAQNWKYFATKNADGVITYEWRDVRSDAPVGCNTLGLNGNDGFSKYDASALSCKTTTSAFTTLSGNSGQAKPFSADEFVEYGRV